MARIPLLWRSTRSALLGIQSTSPSPLLYEYTRSRILLLCYRYGALMSKGRVTELVLPHPDMRELANSWLNYQSEHYRHSKCRPPFGFLNQWISGYRSCCNTNPFFVIVNWGPVCLTGLSLFIFRCWLMLSSVGNRSQVAPLWSSAAHI